MTVEELAATVVTEMIETTEGTVEATVVLIAVTAVGTGAQVETALRPLPFWYAICLTV